MAVYFFDTSAIVKRYILEAGTSWVHAAVDPPTGNLVYLARISIVEMASAITRRQRNGDLPESQARAVLEQFRHDMASEYRVIEITPDLLSSAALMAESHGLRAYDAVQLAVALGLDSQRITNGMSPTTLVSADEELNVAAVAAGMSVENPNRYP
jgi:uncharacterized protein